MMVIKCLVQVLHANALHLLYINTEWAGFGGIYKKQLYIIGLKKQ